MNVAYSNSYVSCSNHSWGGGNSSTIWNTGTLLPIIKPRVLLGENWYFIILNDDLEVFHLISLSFKGLCLSPIFFVFTPNCKTIFVKCSHIKTFAALSTICMVLRRKPFWKSKTVERGSWVKHLISIQIQKKFLHTLS